MKFILAISSVLFFTGVHAQTLRLEGDTLNEMVDSIGTTEIICFDSAVFSYSIDYVVKQQSVHVEGVNNCYRQSGKLPKGTVLHFSKLMYTGYDGKTRKLKDRKYIVK